nr:alpha-1,6-mannosyltransferase [Cryptococcus depauperatus CBS 7855]
MARIPIYISRNFLRSTPAELLLIFFVLFFYFSLPSSHASHPLLLINGAVRQRLEDAQLPELVDHYERARLLLLAAKRFNSTATTKRLTAPESLSDGTTNYDTDLDVYHGRLKNFVDIYLQDGPAHILTGGRNALKNLLKHLPAKHQNGNFPAKIWSTHPSGIHGVKKGFELWGQLLPLPLSPSIANHLSVEREVDFLKPAREGQDWEVQVLDDDGLDKLMSNWTGESLARGVMGKGKWGRLWGKLQQGVLRADFFRYVSMFVEGGIYSDSDTMVGTSFAISSCLNNTAQPISHPYVWGVHAPSILHPDIETLRNLLHAATLPKVPLNTRPPRIDPRFFDNKTYTPPYSGLIRRAPVYALSSPDPSSILNPEISMVVAIEWDSQIGRTLKMWRQWTWFRLKRSWPDCCYPRSIEIVQNLLVAKPFHPIMMDTVATIAQLVETDNYQHLGPLELTGPGPFTDAVFRYLLIQYGVTPNDLRALRGPVRVGDILILQEEAWHAPQKAIQRLISYVESLHLKLGTNRHGRFSPWVFGIGWKDWRSGGVKVAYHGLTGMWKNKN